MVKPVGGKYVFPRGLYSELKLSAQLAPVSSLLNGDLDNGPMLTVEAFRDRQASSGVEIRFEFAKPFMLARLVLHPGDTYVTYGVEYERYRMCPRKVALTFNDEPFRAAMRFDLTGRWKHRTPLKLDIFRRVVSSVSLHMAASGKSVKVNGGFAEVLGLAEVEFVEADSLPDKTASAYVDPENNDLLVNAEFKTFGAVETMYMHYSREALENPMPGEIMQLARARPSLVYRVSQPGAVASRTFRLAGMEVAEFSPGYVYLTAEATDAAEQKVTVLPVQSFDLTPPTLAVTSVRATPTGEVRIAYEAADEHSLVARVAMVVTRSAAPMAAAALLSDPRAIDLPISGGGGGGGGGGAVYTYTVPMEDQWAALRFALVAVDGASNASHATVTPTPIQNNSGMSWDTEEPAVEALSGVEWYYDEDGVYRVEFDYAATDNSGVVAGFSAVVVPADGDDAREPRDIATGAADFRSAAAAGRASIPVAGPGTYRIRAVALDRQGNVGEALYPPLLTVGDTAPPAVVALDVRAVTITTVEVRVHVRDLTALASIRVAVFAGAGAGAAPPTSSGDFDPYDSVPSRHGLSADLAPPPPGGLYVHPGGETEVERILTLGGLLDNTDYACHVYARDMFGNEVVSPALAEFRTPLSDPPHLASPLALVARRPGSFDVLADVRDDVAIRSVFAHVARWSGNPPERPATPTFAQIAAVGALVQPGVITLSVFNPPGGGGGVSPCTHTTRFTVSVAATDVAGSVTVFQGLDVTTLDETPPRLVRAEAESVAPGTVDAEWEFEDEGTHGAITRVHALATESALPGGGGAAALVEALLLHPDTVAIPGPQGAATFLGLSPERTNHLYVVAEDDAQSFGAPANLFSAPFTALFRPAVVLDPVAFVQRMGTMAVESTSATARVDTATGNRSHLLLLRPSDGYLTAAELLALLPPLGG